MSTSEAADETTVEPAAVIRLVRDLLGSDSTSVDADGGEAPHFDSPTITVDCAEAGREEAGELLWDLSSDAANASLMVDNHVLDVLACVIQSGSSDRLAEICMGIAGNLACQHNTAACLTQAGALREAVYGHAVWRDDPACLSEVCRLSSGILRQQHSEAWLGSMLSESLLDRLGWIMSNTLNSTLLERACTLTADLAGTGEVAVEAVLGRSLLDMAAGCLQQHLQVCSASEAEADPGWDADADDGDASFPSLAAVDAALDVLEALSEDDAGLQALRASEDTLQLLAVLLQRSTALAVRGRAAVLLAVLDAPATHQHFSESAAALQSLLRLLLDCSSGEGMDFVEACWALTASVAQRLNASPARATDEVLQVILAEAAGLGGAATKMPLEGAAVRTAGYALLKLASAVQAKLPGPDAAATEQELPRFTGQAPESSSHPSGEGTHLAVNVACNVQQACAELQTAAHPLLQERKQDSTNEVS